MRVLLDVTAYIKPLSFWFLGALFGGFAVLLTSTGGIYAVTGDELEKALTWFQENLLQLLALIGLHSFCLYCSWRLFRMRWRLAQAVDSEAYVFGFSSGGRPASFALPLASLTCSFISLLVLLAQPHSTSLVSLPLLICISVFSIYEIALGAWSLYEYRRLIDNLISTSGKTGEPVESSVRYVLFWPALYGIALVMLSGCLTAYLLLGAIPMNGLSSFQDWIKLLSMFAVLVIVSAVYASRLFRDKRTAIPTGERDKAIKPSGYHTLVLLSVVLFCIFLGRYECLFILIGCAVATSFDCWRIIIARRSHDVIYEQTYNISMMIILFVTMLIVSAGFSSLRSIIPVGYAAYYSIVCTGIVVGSGYYGHYLLGDDTEISHGRDNPAVMHHRKLAALGLCVTLLLIVPFLFNREVAQLQVFYYGASGFFDLLAAFTGLLSLLSLSIPVDTSHGQSHDTARGVSAFFTNLRNALGERLKKYSSGDAYGHNRFHRTYCEVMIICVFVAYFVANVIASLRECLACFSVVIFVALVVSLIMDFYFHTSEKKL